MTDPTAPASSRLANPMTRVPALGAIGRELAVAVNGGAVPAATMTFAYLRVGQIVGSDYLIQMHAEGLRRLGESEERISAVASWRDSPLFTAQEEIALAIAEALLTDADGGDRVSDDLYTAAAREFDDVELTTLLIALGQVLFYVPLALVGKPLAGVDPSRQWRP